MMATCLSAIRTRPTQDYPANRVAPAVESLLCGYCPAELNLAIAGTIFGDATVTMLKLGTGRVELQGSSANFFGDFNVQEGVASVENITALGINTTTNVSSEAPAALDLEGNASTQLQSEAITLSGGGARGGSYSRALCCRGRTRRCGRPDHAHGRRHHREPYQPEPGRRRRGNGFTLTFSRATASPR